MISQMFGMASSAPVSRRMPPSLDPTSQIMAIHSRLDALELALSGLWELLKVRAGLTDEEIASFVREVDLRDGRLDGRISQAQALCPSCGRRLLSRGHHKCLWCGQELPEFNARREAPLAERATLK